MQTPVITIDGPSGTGKGTLAAAVAKDLQFMYLDSGALYRALAYMVIRDEVQVSSNDALSQCINAVEIKLTPCGQVICNGMDISSDIREEKVGMMASTISANPLVRQRLLQLQRDQKQAPGLVTDGRDMGTVVFPHADIKIYLDASSAVRAARRYNQLKSRGIDVNLRDIEKELIIRDQQDSEREFSPLKPAADAVVIDSSKLSIDEVFCDVMKIVRSRL